MKKKILSIILLLTTSLNAQKIYRLAGTGTSGHSGDGGLALQALIGNTQGMTVDIYGYLLFIDQKHCVRRIDISNNIITTITDTVPGYTGDGGQSDFARLYNPVGITTDAIGIIYITDKGNSRIRRINLGGIITTICGTGVYGFSGDGGPASLADVNGISGIAVDKFGNIIFADRFNQRIRKINTSGIISTIAGTGVAGFSGDGGLAINAKLDNPSGLALDTMGNIYFIDEFNYRMRKINISSGIITTIAGNGVIGFGGDGGLGTSASISPRGIYCDKVGNVFLTEGSLRVRVIYPNGIIDTYAGLGIPGNTGDGGPAYACQLSGPNGITMDNDKNLYIGPLNGGNGSYTLRVICPSACYAEIDENSKEKEITFYPNPCSTSFKIKLNFPIKNGKVILHNVIGQKITERVILDDLEIPVNSFTKGLYTLTISENGSNLETRRLIIE